MSRSKRSNPLLPFVVGGVAAVIAAAAGRRLFRHTQLFCPSRDPLISWDPADYGVPLVAVEEVWFETPDGEELHGWYCRSDHPVASTLFCHGNSGNLTNNANVISHLLDAGLNVLFFDYRGFGKSSGHPSLDGVVQDGITAARFHETIRPKGIPSILHGYSLGGAVAAQIMRRHAFDGLILHSTFTNLPQLARVAFPRIPLHMIAGSAFDTLSVVRRLSVPLLVIHGTEDETVPCWMGRALYEACPSQKHLEIIEGGLHKDLFERAGDELVWALSRFAKALPSDSRAIPAHPEPVSDALDALLRKVRRQLRKAPHVSPGSPQTV